MTTARTLRFFLALCFVSASAFAQTGERPDLSQLPAGSNNMFPPIPTGSAPPAAAATPALSYSSTPVPPPTTYQQMPQMPAQFQQPSVYQQMPGQYQQPTYQPMQMPAQFQQPSPYQGQFPQGQDAMGQSVPFDPSQFRGFNPNQMQRPAGQQREERFTPSEIVSGLPPAKMASDLRAVLRTSMGDITIKLDKLHAPATVNHFVALARGDKEFVDVKTSKRVKRPFYNGLIFHRVVKGHLIQTGCPFGNGRGGPGDIAMMPDEIKPMMKFNRPGLVAMAPMREDGTKIRKDSNGSQFFISLKEMPEWDEKFTIFGEVEDGMDVVQKIANVKVGPTERPIKRVFLTAIDIFEGSGDQLQQVPPVPPQDPATAPVQ